MAGKCTRHPKNYTLFLCPNCAKSLCFQCIQKREIGIGASHICPDCDVPVDALGAGKVPFEVLALEVLKAPFESKSAIIFLLASVVFSSILQLLMAFNTIFWPANYMLGVIVVGVYASFISMVIKSFAEGGLVVPTGYGFSDWHDLMGSAYLFTGAFVVTWLPFGLYLGVRIFLLGAFSVDGMLLIDFFVLGVLALYGLICTPMALSVVLFSGSIIQACNPVFIVRLISIVPRGYFITAGAIFLASLLIEGVGGVILFTIDRSTGVLFINLLIAWIVHFYNGFVCAAILGMMLYRYKDRLGMDYSKRAQPKEDSFGSADLQGADVVPFQPRELSHVEPIELSSEVETPLESTPQSVVELQSDVEYSLGIESSLGLGPPSDAESPEQAEKQGSENYIKLPDEGLNEANKLPVIELPPLPPIDLPAPDSISEADSIPAPDPVSTTAQEEASVSEPPQKPIPEDSWAELDENAEPQAQASVPLAIPIGYVQEEKPKRPTPRLDKACSAYKARLVREPDWMLEPDVQWAIASHFERLKQWEDAVEAYSKMGILEIAHPKAPDGLLRASYLAYERLKSSETTRRFLEHLKKHYPKSSSAKKADKVLEFINPAGS